MAVRLGSWQLCVRRRLER